MSWDKNKLISKIEIQEKITETTVNFAEEFGGYLAQKEDTAEPLTTSQLRKFFGEVKRQQMIGYDETEFIMLKPKLAYAVGRAKQNGRRGKVQKIEDFYYVMADAIDKVESSTDKQKAFKNFITAFEAIVAYHKAAEKK
ncbi:MAG: type III-A CRISPR-associated protein Csm2 [Prevotella sp.]|nr:type III-A CRISPR-associated protein Csm2 [Prevotella sp.]